MKRKVLIIFSIFVLLLFFSGITYSIFNSSASLSSSDQGIAKFIFNAEATDQIELSLKDLIPGENKEYLFSINNSREEDVSDVTIEYEMTIKTYHFVPVVIELYKIGTNDSEQLISTCDESPNRNLENELVCNVPVQQMPYSSEVIDNYKLKVIFPSNYNDSIYSDLVDYINIGIQSWQK